MKFLQILKRRKGNRESARRRNDAVCSPDRPATDRPFHLDPRPSYLVFGWGYFPPTRNSGQHYIRVRRYIGSRDPCVSARVANRKIISTILAGERRTIQRDQWAEMFNQPSTHVIRFGWQSVHGQCYDLFYLPVAFTVPGFHSDGLARAFGSRLIESVHRCQEATWLLCPATVGDHTLSAAVFWLAAAHTNWLEQDLKMPRQP